MPGFWARLGSWFRLHRRHGGPEEILGYRFREPRLLREALTHRSYAYSVRPEPTYERLEFLGDSVLGLVVARRLFEKYPCKSEGELTKLKASLVNTKTLTHVARREGLSRRVRLSPEEDRAGGRQRGSILSDVLESVIGAIYLDGGIEAATAVIDRILLRSIDARHPELLEINYKGELLEYLQGQGQGMPRYEVVAEAGPDHQKLFTVVVHANGRPVGRGVGPNKKQAEQEAAREALAALGIDNGHETPQSTGRHR